MRWIHALSRFLFGDQMAFGRIGALRLYFLVVVSLLIPAASAQDPLRIGSKRFTESFILAQVLAQAAAPHVTVEVRAGLGNTAIVHAALRAGSIDLYPEYVGTIALEVLKDKEAMSLAVMREQLMPLGLGVAVPLGFNDGYALAMREDKARALNITSLTDLAKHPNLKFGLSNEFIGRQDGWRGLAKHYRLTQTPTGLDHGLAYGAITADQVDVIDIYTTDAKIGHLGLRVLTDSAAYFPRYDAVVLYRLDVPQRFPAAWTALEKLSGTINEKEMIAMNAKAELQGLDFALIAQQHLAGRTAATESPPSFLGRLFGPDFLRLTWQHLSLVFSAVIAAAVVGVPLAVLVTQHPGPRAVLLGAIGVLQTVPSLAMLAILISWSNQIGTIPALIALTLYALLPIIQNTCTGLAEVHAGLSDAGKALGLTASQRLRLIELPLCAPSIITGIRIATSISIGTATIAAFIGAGGYGERIVTGLALNDQELMLAGALPSAVMALLFEGTFAWYQAKRRRKLSGLTH
jgi:osmoprotectant transport system permease protein